MLLFELLNKPIEWRQRPDGRNTKSFTFELEDGRLYIVYFIQNDLTRSGIKIWEASFKDMHDERGMSNAFDKTGKGNELVIFSTVLQIITHFVAKNPEDIVMFSAEETNRQTLYLRMLGRYIKPPMAFEVDEEDFYIGHQDLINELDV